MGARRLAALLQQIRGTIQCHTVPYSGITNLVVAKCLTAGKVLRSCDHTSARGAYSWSFCCVFCGCFLLCGVVLCCVGCCSLSWCFMPCYALLCFLLCHAVLCCAVFVLSCSVLFVLFCRILTYSVFCRLCFFCTSLPHIDLKTQLTVHVSWRDASSRGRSRGG